MSNIHLFITEDGSKTLFNSEKNEHYHSIHGAVQESIHVFIKAGLLKLINTKNDIRILEVGFGTGLNALLTLKESLVQNGRSRIKIEYISLEPSPIPFSLLPHLGYDEFLNAKDLHDSFLKMHYNVGFKQDLNQAFSFTLLNQKLEEYQSIDQFDLVYFDAFSPQTQGELWNISIFEKLFSMMCGGGVLVTYCSKGNVRRTLQECGFKVERLPGPPGKHEMLRAMKG